MNRNWSNTALVAYSLLPKIGKKLDFALQTRLKMSFQSKHLQFGISNERLIGEIIEINDEKRKLANLRYIVNTAMEQILPEHRQILLMRIDDKKTFQDIAQAMSLSLRTVFRRMQMAEESFAAALHRLGYSEEWFENEYGKDVYILPIRNSIVEDKYIVVKAM